MTSELYDEIGGGYHTHRRPDPRIADAIYRALGDADTIVNVGAGAGSYEPMDRRVVAVEPAFSMIRQRGAGSAPAVQASATHLPFRDAAFAAALAILTLHHWPDRARGLAELARVARRRVVMLTWDPASPDFWLIAEYFPALASIDRPIFPTMEDIRGVFAHIEIHALPIPHDCSDGFLGAYWRRPHAYLDPGVRGAMSTFTKLATLEPGLTHLRRDLEDGSWERRHLHLLAKSELDLGYRLVIATIAGRRLPDDKTRPPRAKF
ncbi:MAG TPA: methyltransferase domain-containing protein [Methylomirabilota bacterium]